MGKDEKVFSLHLPLATKQRTFSLSFHWSLSKEPSPSPSIGHQAKNLLLHLPLATKQRTFSFTFHWPPNFGSTFTFIFLLFKRWIRIIGSFFFLGHNFQFNLENICSHKLLEEKKKWSALVVGNRKESRMEIL